MGAPVPNATHPEPGSGVDCEYKPPISKSLQVIIAATMGQNRTAQVVNFVRRLYQAPALRFALVGGVNTLVDIGIFSQLLYRYHWPLLAARAAGFTVAVVNSYLMNKVWSFRKRRTGREAWRRAGLFYLIALGGLAISSVVIRFADLVMHSLCRAFHRGHAALQNGVQTALSRHPAPPPLLVARRATLLHRSSEPVVLTIPVRAD
jgi:putative flippase GtrA